MDLTAIDVINQFLEFQSLVLNTAMWKESELMDNPPRLYRFNQLQALFRAFDLGQLPEFENGNFVEKRPVEGYQIIFDKVQKDFKNLELYNEIYILNLIKGRDNIRYVTDLFKRLFLYRKRLSQVLTFNSGVLAASHLYYYALLKTEELNKIINENLEPIDTIIGLIISPNNQSFSRKQLIEKFDYPDVNLSEIDIKWM